MTRVGVHMSAVDLCSGLGLKKGLCFLGLQLAWHDQVIRYDGIYAHFLLQPHVLQFVAKTTKV